MEVRAKKGLGQHFLTDQAIAQNIVGALKGSPVLEVGPGMGVLTRYLLTRSDGVCSGSTASQSSAPPFASLTVPPLNVPRVAVVSPPAAPSDRDETPELQLKAVEIDKESVDYLRKHFPQLGEGLIEGDFLKMDLATVFPGEYSVIGNFPYNISSQIFFKILDHKDIIPEVVCMIQKEVAERIAEKPGTKTYGILSVFLQAWYDIEYLFTVGSGAFNPPPKVQSAVIRLTRNSRTSLGCDEKLFRSIVKASFGQRRTTLRNSLKPLIPASKKDGPASILTDPVFELRPERLGVEDFVRLTNLCTPT